MTQLDTQINMPLADLEFMAPVKAFPEDFSDADKDRLTAAYDAKTREIYAANTRLRDFLRDEYLPVARDSIGLSQMKGGEVPMPDWSRNSTTLKLDPEAVHQLGLREVARIQREMDGVRMRLGFKEPLRAFFDDIRTNPRYHPKTKQELPPMPLPRQPRRSMRWSRPISTGFPRANC